MPLSVHETSFFWLSTGEGHLHDVLSATEPVGPCPLLHPAGRCDQAGDTGRGWGAGSVASAGWGCRSWHQPLSCCPVNPCRLRELWVGGATGWGAAETSL